ncbi:MAG TPA: GNAT family N-acetyltransferase [Candidatus Dormibacteraeota bacterium]
MSASAAGLKELDPASAEWAALAAGTPEATAFHHPAWTRALADAYGHRSTVLALLGAGGRVDAAAVLARVRRPRQSAWVALPFADHCPVLARDAGSRDRFADCLAAWGARQGVPVEVRGGIPVMPGWPEATIAVRHVLPLDGDATAQRARIHATHAKRLRQAEGRGLGVRLGRSKADVADFYRLHVATRRRLGVPVQPRAFFEAIWRHLIAAGLGIVALAEPPGGPPVAGAVVLAWNRTAIMKFQASDAAAWRFRPNHLVYWTAIRWAAEAGNLRFDLGRTDAGDDGLLQWKAGWGAEGIPLRYSRTAGPAAAGAGGEGPLAAAMRHVIRRSPAFVCRGLGALLYRYAA